VLVTANPSRDLAFVFEVHATLRQLKQDVLRLNEGKQKDINTTDVVLVVNVRVDVGTSLPGVLDGEIKVLVKI
jgi:hypothetical protein